MYYFVDESDLTVVSRPHKYNAEAVDGKITSIDMDESCYLVGHLPTKKFTYQC